MEREQITLDQFVTRLQAQGVPQEHCAFRCVRCGHIQSTASLVRYLPPGDAGNADWTMMVRKTKSLANSARQECLWLSPSVGKSLNRLPLTLYKGLA